MMALSRLRSSSSSSSSTQKFKYDVFLSFRGDDTRNNFASHLHKALCDKQIETFIDDQLIRGDEISPSLLKAIEESMISVVIFSKDYASSRWCLEELVKILECSKNSNQIVMPVFYGVEPTHIRNQTGDFAVAFADHEQRFKENLDKVQAWKDVLRRAANFSGWNSDTVKPESALVEKIVEDILKRLNDMYRSCHDKNLVGIYSRIKQVESFLRSTGDFGSVGIWGIGGIGKTTLAHAVYDRISCQFEGSCFVESIRETSEQSGGLGLNNLRQRLVSELLGEENACIGAFTSTRLGRKKLLIVFDDVTDIRQVGSLTRDLVCLGLGSRIIVTSRNKKVLRNICGDDQIYKVEDLCFNDALKLFCQYAFHKNNPEVDYEKLSNGVVEKVGGVPLALKVLGSSLFHERKEVWDSAMQKLEHNFDREIHKVLKISYDGLDNSEKSMFLDITCFFNRWNIDLVKAIMDASGFVTGIGISVLVDKSLITISDSYELQMHDLVQAMGKEIVRQVSINYPGKRRRLWHHNDIYDILTTDTGTDSIVGISSDMSKTSNIHLHPRAFVNMQILRFLQFYVSNYCENNKMYISQGLKSVFTQLRYLSWYGFPLKSLQSNCHSKNLVKLNMHNSNIEELWSGVQQLDNLKTIDLSGSKHLIRCPDFSGTPKLESLKLSFCTRLIGIPQSIQYLNKLESLDVEGCNFTKFPLISGSIERLNLSGTAIEEVPSSIQSLTNLTELKLAECTRLKHISTSICKLKSLSILDLTGCSKLEIFPEILETMESLKALKLSAFPVIRPDSKLVGETVCTELRSKYIPSPSEFEGLIGINKRLEHVKSLLCLEMKDVRKIIWIWGMGGVGKTTIARAVFKSISDQFDGACFIEKVGKRLENGISDRLQLEVLSEVLHEENLKLGTTTIRPFIMELLNQKKVFIVLDDVNNLLQLETLAQGLNRCGLGSRIIITARDNQVLCNFSIDDHEIYEAERFNDDEALELFHKHANPTKDCMELLEKIVNYAKGNPLALEVLGLSLKGMSKQVWESALKKLQGVVNSGIFDVLKISYDGLNEEEKKLFLDVACFGDLYNYHGLLKEEFLDCLEYSLSGLVAKLLITRHIRTGDIEMHDLLQEMGREIIRRESPNHSGKRSRLWERNDVIWTLEKNTGTDVVEVISLDMDGLEDEDIHLNSQVFDKMHNLRFLIFHSMYGSDKVLHLPNDLNCLPDELMFLHWFGYPLRALPLNFKPKKLVKLDLVGSNIEQLWEGTKCAPKLKWLNLSYCEHLTRIPNLSDFPLLVEVDLSHCTSLVDFPSSVQQHNNLRNLNMSETAIEEVPSSIQSLTNLTELKLAECTRLKHISTRICKLKSLSTLDLTDCSKLKIFPEILETMESLKALKLSAFLKINMDLKVLPYSIEHLNGLQTLQLSFCENLEMLPSSICNLTSLEDLDLSNCTKLDKLPDDLGNLKSLKRLNVEGSTVGQLPSSIACLGNLEDLDCSECSLMEIPESIGYLSSLKKLKLSRNMFESLPKSIKQLSKLEFVSLSHCNMLRSLPEFPEGLECLEAMDCDQLCQVPDASEFVRCINSKSHFANYYHHHRVDFIFTNSLNLIKAVSNVFEESLRIMQCTEKGSGKPPNEFSIYLPGNKIPEGFRHRSLESSLNIEVLRNDLVNRKFMGFAICAVFGCDENSTRVRFTHGVGCVFQTYYDHIKICNGNRIYRTHYGSDLPSIFIDSDHMLLGYCSFYSRNPMELPAGDSDHVDISIEFKIHDNGNQLKRWAVHPIYAEEPIGIIGATIQEIGETSGRRSDRFDDNDEEVEPHPKRICTQEI